MTIMGSQLEDLIEWYTLEYVSIVERNRIGPQSLVDGLMGDNRTVRGLFAKELGVKA